MTAEERSRRTAEADLLCRTAYDASGCPTTGAALVAVGGYGRGELAPFSDLDVLLVHDDGVLLAEGAAALWYPLWDSGRTIDHAVRSVPETVERAEADPRVALGLLDVRHLAGDPNLTLRLRAAVLASWRREARRRLPELRELVAARNDRLGELADAAVPDLKESTGGLRDATVLTGLVATWLVDVPHADLERCRRALLDIRDVVQALHGRASDRVAPELWSELAGPLGLPDALAAQRHVRALGRRVTHLSRLAWRRADAVQRRPAGSVRRPRLDPVAPGVAVSYDEVVLDRGAAVDRDASLLLRLAVEAAERRLVLAPTGVARLVRSAPPLPDPWPAGARELWVRLLAAGPGLLPVWETLDETGALDRLVPGWERVRLLPHASTVHRFTVDRHLVETCIEAAALLGRVARPDVLVVAALLHDIGKGEPGDHSEAGAPLAVARAAGWGFDEADAALVGRLVRHHLLLPQTATTRDLADPATVASVLAQVPDRGFLDLLAALTEADARATSEQAWSRWRAGLVRDLVRRTARALAAVAPAEPTPRTETGAPSAGAGEVSVTVRVGADLTTVTVVAPDRVGLLADVAGALALQRAPVRSARVWTQDDNRVRVGVSEWVVAGADLDAAVLRQRLRAIAEGSLDPSGRLRGGGGGQPPVVLEHPDASTSATVLEVRAQDRPGLIHVVCAALAGLGIAVRSAHVATLGPQAVDVFYVHEPAGGPLAPDRTAAALAALTTALT
ncbi:MAG: [protein-PII] uridylyltransferase [Marmoricola sp.]